MKELLLAILSLTHETEFWSAIAGAVVGGLIVVATQIIALRASKKQRVEDRLLAKQALANSLLFKVIRVHSNVFGIHHHIETCYSEGSKQASPSEPWNFIIPLANPPELVSFTSDEMAMLLSLKDDELFNLIMSMDVTHNSLVEMLKLLTVTRKDLTDRLTVQNTNGIMLSGVLTENERRALLPKMIEVNTLADQVRQLAKKYYDESSIALDGLATLVRAKLNLTYKIERVSRM